MMDNIKSSAASAIEQSEDSTFDQPLLKVVKIRDFKLGDEKIICEIHKENEEFFEDFSVSEEFILEISQRRDFKFFIAQYFNEVIGFSGVLFYSSVGRAEIGPINIKKEFKEKGIGKLLMQHTIEFLKNERIRRITTKIKIDNKRAINFFSSLGFEQEGYFKNYTKRGEDVVQLVKFI